MTYDQQHPITPPPELKAKWAHLPADWDTVVSLIVQWGADQELEACCELLKQKGVPAWSLLRAARRPKPPGLKKQALEALDDFSKMSETLYSSYDPPEEIYSDQVDIIRHALEALPDDL